MQSICFRFLLSICRRYSLGLNPMTKGHVLTIVHFLGFGLSTRMYGWRHQHLCCPGWLSFDCKLGFPAD